MSKMFALLSVKTGEIVNVPLAPGRSQSLFSSVEEARSADPNGSFRNRMNYQVRPVDIKIITTNIDPASPEEVKKAEKHKAYDDAIKKEMDDLDIIDPEEQHNFMYERRMKEVFEKAIQDLVDDPKTSELALRFHNWLDKHLADHIKDKAKARVHKAENDGKVVNINDEPKPKSDAE